MNASGYPTRDEVSAILEKVKTASGKGLTRLSLIALLGLPGGCAQSSMDDGLQGEKDAGVSGSEEPERHTFMGTYDSFDDE